MDAETGRALEQIEFIERMIREGQRSMEMWGWSFVMWGCGHLGALAWSHVWPSDPGAPWAILMSACALAMLVAAILRSRRGRSTGAGRAIAGVWMGFAVSFALFWIVGSWRQMFTSEAAFLATFFLLAGGANFASGVAVRLPVQALVGATWWLCAVAALVQPGAATWIFVASAIACEILFGLHLMARERKAEADRGGIR